jgi:hypothetical protein
MSAPVVRTPGLRRTDLLVHALAVAAAALLAIDAYVHFHDAGLYDISTGAAITQGLLFRVQASIALLAALSLLIRPRWIVWAVVVIVAASAALAVYLYTYVDVGRLGPLPDMYEPTWATPGKRLAAAAEIAAMVVGLLGLAVTLMTRKTRKTHGWLERSRAPHPAQ